MCEIAKSNTGIRSLESVCNCSSNIIDKLVLRVRLSYSKLFSLNLFWSIGCKCLHESQCFRPFSFLNPILKSGLSESKLKKIGGNLLGRQKCSDCRRRGAATYVRTERVRLEELECDIKNHGSGFCCTG